MCLYYIMDPKQVLPDQLQSGTNMHSAVFQNKMSGGSGEGITTGFAVSDIRPGLAGYTRQKVVINQKGDKISREDAKISRKDNKISREDDKISREDAIISRCVKIK